MTKRYVSLSHGGKVELGQYVAGVKFAKANPAQTFKRGLTGWWPVTGAEIVQQFNDGVADRISRHVPWFGNGRKWSPEWQLETWRASRDLNTPRLAIHYLPPWMKDRFADRLS